MKFPVVFTGTERRIFLDGEAYFEVVKDEKNPFMVEFSDGVVRVLGTIFNIKAYENQNACATLLSGRVGISSGKDSVILQPGEQCEIVRESGTLAVREADLMTALAWKNGEFVFKDATLKQVMDELSRWYNTDIEYDTAGLKGVEICRSVFKGKVVEISTTFPNFV